MVTKILLLGHGSRAQKAVDGMLEVAEQLRANHGIPDLLVCQMEGLGLGLLDAIRACYAEGHRHILVQPYFLHSGTHLREDIPNMLREAHLEFPDLELELGRHLGADPALADLVSRRIRESLEECKM